MCVGGGRGHFSDVYDLSWSVDGGALVSGSIDNHAIVWDVRKMAHVDKLDEHGTPLTPATVWPRSSSGNAPVRAIEAEGSSLCGWGLLFACRRPLCARRGHGPGRCVVRVGVCVRAFGGRRLTEKRHAHRDLHCHDEQRSLVSHFPIGGQHSDRTAGLTAAAVAAALVRGRH